jgi:hypothetical protein
VVTFGALTTTDVIEPVTLGGNVGTGIRRRIGRRRTPLDGLGRNSEGHHRRVAALTVFLAFLVAGCGAMYASGHSAADLPKRRDAVVLEGFSRGGKKDPSPPAPSEDEAHQIEVARDAVLRLFKANDLSLLDDPGECPDCLRLKVDVLFQPWNPLIGGHVIIIMHADGASGAELFLTTGVGSVTLATVTLGYDYLTRRAVDQAAEKFIMELHGKFILPEKPQKEAALAPARPAR